MSVDLNETIAQASLKNLNDIIVPEAVGLFPLAPGWIIVILLATSLLFHFVFKAYSRYKRSLYKREALKELESYTKESREEILALLALAKRVAIASYGRTEIAQLSGESWWDFMEQHSKVEVPKEIRTYLSNILYDVSKQGETSNYTEVKRMVALWIKTHKGNNHA